MRNYVLYGALGLSLLLTGCSGYYRTPLETEKEGPDIQIVESAEEENSGPDQAENDDIITPHPESGEDQAVSSEIILASDLHYLAKELTDFGESFQSFVDNGDGKMTAYVWEITDAFFDEVIERAPQAFILSGDLTLEGERLSHEALADQLRRVEAAGTQVLVIPGNHDVNNPSAGKFRGDQKEPAEPASPKQFAEIYEEYGYGEAISRDPASLSYMYELPDGTRILMLDSCQYEEVYRHEGVIRSETYDWMEQVLEEAWDAGSTVVAVGHHNLLEETRVYGDMYTIEHAEELEQMLGEWGVFLYLSGHLHVQHFKTSSDYAIDEIASSSICTSPFLYGVLELTGGNGFSYYTREVNVSQWALRHNNPDQNLQDFGIYADEFLQQIFYREAMSGLEEIFMTEEERVQMAQIYAILKVYDTAGRAVDIRESAMVMPGYEKWQSLSRSNLLAMELNEIIEDATLNYNQLQRP